MPTSSTKSETGFVLVTKEVFFAAIGPLNVHPRSTRDRDYWETPSRQVLGITTPGYLETGDRTYSVRTVLAKAEGR